MAVPTVTIVEDFNIIEHIGTRQFTGFVDPFLDSFLLDSFLLEAAEELLRHSFVQAVATAAHTRLQVMMLAEALPTIAAVL